MALARADIGHGIGLRSKHYPGFLGGTPKTGWVEAISENFMGVGGRPLAVLEHVREQCPVALHGVSLSLGGTGELHPRHLADLRQLVDRLEPVIVSDHLCWGTHAGRYVHDLLPLPFTTEAVDHVVRRVQRVQDFLGRQLLLENVSSYLTYAHSEMTEWEFISEIVQRADCGVLLDLNNLYVNAKNHGFAPGDYLNGIPVGRVGQFHLAGHSDRGSYLFDTHDGPVSAAVWEVHAAAVRRFGAVPTLIEWDENIPSLARLLAESERAARKEREALA